MDYHKLENKIMEGPVIKQGHIILNWCERWMVMTKEQLYYYDMERIRLKGVVPLEFATVKLCEIVGHPHTFEVYSARQKKTYFFQV